jgi:hypothetical protein
MTTFFPSPLTVGSESELFFLIRIRIRQKVLDSFGFGSATLLTGEVVKQLMRHAMMRKDESTDRVRTILTGETVQQLTRHSMMRKDESTDTESGPFSQVRQYNS